MNICKFILTSIFMLLIFSTAWAYEEVENGFGSPIFDKAERIRLNISPDNVLSMQVSVTELLPTQKNKGRILLAGVTHMGTGEYFQSLQTLLDKYPTVLCEGIEMDKEDGDNNKEKNKGIQEVMADAIGLEFQTSGIDYDRLDCKYADVSASQIEESSKGWANKMYMKTFMNLLNPESGSFVQKILEKGLLAAGRDTYIRAMMKVMLMVMLDTTGGELQPTGPMKDIERVLVQERNMVVVEELRTILEDSSSTEAEDIALFYGSGHINDLGERIVNELNYVVGETQWLTSCSVDLENDLKSSLPFLSFDDYDLKSLLRMLDLDVSMDIEE